jgi:hypothetical protein
MAANKKKQKNKNIAQRHYIPNDCPFKTHFKFRWPLHLKTNKTSDEQVMGQCHEN